MENIILPDKTITAIENILHISSIYGYSTLEERSDNSSPVCSLINLLELINKTNDALNQVIFQVKISQFKELNERLKQFESLDTKYPKSINSFKDGLKYLIDNSNKIVEALDKPLQDESNKIEMGLKYQKQAVDYIKNAKSDFVEMATNSALFKDLANALNNPTNADILKYEAKFCCMVDKLKQCVEQLLEFYSFSAKKKQEN